MLSLAGVMLETCRAVLVIYITAVHDERCTIQTQSFSWIVFLSQVLFFKDL